MLAYHKVKYQKKQAKNKKSKKSKNSYPPPQGRGIEFSNKISIG